MVLSTSAARSKKVPAGSAKDAKNSLMCLMSIARQAALRDGYQKIKLASSAEAYRQSDGHRKEHSFKKLLAFSNRRRILKALLFTPFKKMALQAIRTASQDRAEAQAAQNKQLQCDKAFWLNRKLEDGLRRAAMNRLRLNEREEAFKTLQARVKEYDFSKLENMFLSRKKIFYCHILYEHQSLAAERAAPPKCERLRDHQTAVSKLNDLLQALQSRMCFSLLRKSCSAEGGQTRGQDLLSRYFSKLLAFKNRKRRISGLILKPFRRLAFQSIRRVWTEPRKLYSADRFVELIQVMGRRAVFQRLKQQLDKPEDRSREEPKGSPKDCLIGSTSDE